MFSLVNDMIEDLVSMLLEACDTLDAMERCASSSSTADRIRERLKKMGFKSYSEESNKE